MDWGIKNRLSKIFQEDGKTVMLAVDHGYFQGPTTGLEKPGELLKPLLQYADALMITRGILRNCIPHEKSPPVVLRVSGGTSILKDDLSQEGLTTDIDDAIRLNVSAITLSIFVGGDGERESLLNLGELVNWGERYGIPILAVTAVGREMARDARYLGLACRIAAEIGAHFVKTYYCDDFEKVVNSTPVPIVIAGGKKIPEADALKLAHNAISAGASGVDMGRNIFQAENPEAMIRAVRAVVHDDVSPEKAFEMYEANK